MKGIDYSFARPGGAAIKADGNDFVLRYIPYPGDQGKGLTADELADLRANGLAVGLVFESTGERHLSGFPGGQADAVVARQALTRLKFPDSTAVYFAVDFDAQPSQFGMIDDYQRGAQSILGIGRVGVYGSYAVVERCQQAGTAAWLWQTYAWSGGKRYQSHLYQYRNDVTLNGGAVDLVASYGDEQGLWKVEDEHMTPEEKADFDALKRRLAQVETQLWGENPVTPRTTYQGVAVVQDIVSLKDAPEVQASTGGARVVFHTHNTGGPMDVPIGGGA